MFSSDLSIGEQALSKAAELGLLAQLYEVTRLEVNIHTDPVKLVTGEIDLVEIEGEGVMMQEDLRTEQLVFQMERIAIDPLKAAGGEIHLTQETIARSRVVLTEKDIEKAFNSQYILSKLQNIKVDLDGQPQVMKVQQVEFKIPQEDRIMLKALIQGIKTGEVEQVTVTAIPRVNPEGNCICLQEVQDSQTPASSSQLKDALLSHTEELLNISNFELGDMSLLIQQLTVAVGRLTLEATAYIKQFYAAS